MSRIYIAKETLAKLKKTHKNNNALILAERFNENRPNGETPHSASNTAKIPHFDAHKQTTKKPITDEEWVKIEANANRNSINIALREKRKRKERQDALVQKYGISNISPTQASIQHDRIARKKKKAKVITIRRKDAERHYRAEKPIYSTQGRDYYDYAGEYEARNVEFGHGRKKNWEGAKKSGLNRMIRQQRKLQRDDPNAFDRQAMK